MLYTITISQNSYPVQFGIWGLKRITEELNINTVNLIEAINITAINDQIKLARIGLQEGQKYAARNFNSPIDSQIMNIDDEGVAYLLESDPEVLEKIYSIYVEQCYGKKLETLVAEAEKVDKEAAANLRKLFGRLVTDQTASLYQSNASSR